VKDAQVFCERTFGYLHRAKRNEDCDVKDRFDCQCRHYTQNMHGGKWKQSFSAMNFAWRFCQPSSGAAYLHDEDQIAQYALGSFEARRFVSDQNPSDN
jgi:hypothetical protein